MSDPPKNGLTDQMQPRGAWSFTSDKRSEWDDGRKTISSHMPIIWLFREEKKGKDIRGNF